MRARDILHGHIGLPRQKRTETFVTKEELTVLEFAVKWAPFGGGDEHILPEFGILPHVFYRRLQCLLSRHTANDSVLRRLRDLCTSKLQTSARQHKPHSQVPSTR